MADESHSFASTRARLEDIVTQVRKKDTSLEKSLDLLEEGVRLANACTELIDHQDWVNGPGSAPADEAVSAPESCGPSEDTAETDPALGVSVEAVDGVVFVDGEVVAEVFEVSAFTGGVEPDGEDSSAEESEAKTGDAEPGEPEPEGAGSEADTPADADAPEGDSEEGE